MDEELISLIKRSCNNQSLFEYIIKSINYFKGKNNDFCSNLCESIRTLLIKYPDLSFVVSDSSYFLLKDREVSISEKAIKTNNYSTFIHEITHAIHGLLFAWDIPSDYESNREKRVGDYSYIVRVQDLMGLILDAKLKIIKKLNEKRREQIPFSKTNNLINIEEKVNNDISFIYNTIDEIKKINKEDMYVYQMYSISKEVSKRFEALIDDIKYQEVNDDEQFFHVLTSIEGMMDSMLLGSLHEGFSSGCYYIKGWGHKRDYFANKPENSFVEIIADFAVITAYNDPLAFIMVELFAGTPIYNTLKTSLNKMVGNDPNVKVH